MHYKTIVLELLEQRTELHEQLRLTRRLRPTMEALATELRELHLSWTETLSQANPGSDPSQNSSEAMELALKSLEDHFPSASRQDNGELPHLTNATAIPAARMSRD
jgi:hypothetical protein